MGNSLQDQLIQSGLVSEQRLKETRSAKRKSAKKSGKRGPRQNEAERAAAEAARAEKARKDRELNRQRQEEAERRALENELRQLIHAHRVVREQGELAYNFADGKSLKRLYVNKEHHDRIVAGKLAIVRQDTFYELVPAETAERIQAKDAERILVWNRPAEGDEGDDPYADYKVPDDLMW